jgi:phosphate transport system substrate-binding protein
MIKRSEIFSITLVLIMVLALFGAGCAGNGYEAGESTTEPESILLTGSTTVLPLAQAAAESYLELHPEQSITVNGGGSGVGIAALIDGSTDIAMASRKIKDSEVEEAEANGINPEEYVIAWDGMAVIVHPDNPVDQLTYEQIRGIYNGTYSNWADVGGEDMEIVVEARDSSSGTYEYFKEEVLEDEEYRQDVLAQSSNGAVVQAVSQNDAAIGYIGYAYLSDDVKAVDVNKGDGMVAATTENILAGTYPLSRPLHFYTDGKPAGLAADLINYIFSDEGTEIINEVGYFPAEGSGTTETEPESIILTGSTTVLPLAQAAAESYLELHPEQSITVNGGGSGVGIAALIDGSTDIAMASRKIKDSEAEEAEANGINPEEYVIAWDGMAVIVHPDNPVDQLTYERIRGIYNGTYSNWADVGGENGEIVVEARDSSSGTYEYFKEELLEDEEYRQDVLAQSSNGAVVQAVSQNDAAIGYIGYAYLDDSVKAVDVDKGDGMVAATTENILAGDYPLSRPLHFYTDGKPTGLGADFIGFILSDEGTEIINEVGYFPTD